MRLPPTQPSPWITASSQPSAVTSSPPQTPVDTRRLVRRPKPLHDSFTRKLDTYRSCLRLRDLESARSVFSDYTNLCRDH
jgi:hypothetical protein